MKQAGCLPFQPFIRAETFLSSIIPLLPHFAASGTLEAGIRVLAISALFSILYLCAVVVLHGGFAPLGQMLLILKEMSPLTRRAPAAPQAVGAA